MTIREILATEDEHPERMTPEDWVAILAVIGCGLGFSALAIVIATKFFW